MIGKSYSKQAQRRPNGAKLKEMLPGFMNGQHYYQYKFGGHFKKPRWANKSTANKLGNTVIDYRKGHNSLTTVGAAKCDLFGTKINW